MAGEIDGEAKYFVGVWDGDGEVGMEEVTAVTSYFILQMDVGGHLFRCRIFMYLVISFRCSEDFHLFTDICIACFKPHLSNLQIFLRDLYLQLFSAIDKNVHHHHLETKLL